jgi:hypothetical protein
MQGDGTSRRLFWPLELVFVTTFVVGILGLIWFRIWSAESDGVDWVLLGIAVAAAVVLQLPRFTDLLRRGAIATQLEQAITRIDAIEKQLALIRAGLSAIAADGPIRADLQALARQLEAQGNGERDEIRALRTAVDELRASVEPIKKQRGS